MREGESLNQNFLLAELKPQHQPFRCPSSIHHTYLTYPSPSLGEHRCGGDGRGVAWVGSLPLPNHVILDRSHHITSLSLFPCGTRRHWPCLVAHSRCLIHIGSQPPQPLSSIIPFGLPTAVWILYCSGSEPLLQARPDPHHKESFWAERQD